MTYEKLPSRLKQGKNFCLYRNEPGTDGKKKKVPYQANGARAAPNNPAHFTDYTTVYEAFKQGSYDGIGLLVTENMEVVDVDDCVDEAGYLSPLAREIVDTIDTYAEISPSGRGIHMIAFTDNPNVDTKVYYLKNSKLGLEMYPGGVTHRFMTLTGNILNKSDVNECTESLAKIREKYMTRPTATKSVVEAPGSFLSDESVMEKMLNSKNCEKTKELWEGGNAGKESASEGDAALCTILAFWCGGDEEQMDRIFRKSARMRDKWDEVHGADTYGNLTIKNAVRHCTEFYKPLGKTSAAEDFGSIPTMLQDLQPESNPRYKNGDLGNGRLFADVFKDVARYVPERKMWFIYDGIRWVHDVRNLKAMELCKDLTDALILYLECRPSVAENGADGVHH